MALYIGSDLHAHNRVGVVLDEQDRVVHHQRVSHCLEPMLHPLAPSRASLAGVVVESTDHWYWPVEGLRDAGYRVHLANTAAIQPYAGVPHTDDQSDARWLAPRLRRGLWPTGASYPQTARPLRDLLRQRSQVVRHTPTQRLSLQQRIARHTGSTRRGNRITQVETEDIARRLPEAD